MRWPWFYGGGQTGVRHRGCQTGRQGEAVLLGQEGDRSAAPGRCPVAAWRHHSGLALGKEKEGGGGREAAQSGWEVSLESDGRTRCFGVLRARPSAQSPHPRISAQAVFAVPVSVSLAEGPTERESVTVPAQIPRRPEARGPGDGHTVTPRGGERGALSEREVVHGIVHGSE